MINIIEQRIPIDVYYQLRIGAGLSAKATEAATIGLANSLYAVTVKNELDEYIGMGRVIGDGGCFCQVADICVLPPYQGKGIGKQIMSKIKAYLNTLPETCYISLLADGDAGKLYEQFGFKATLPQSAGMYFKR